MDNNKKFSFRAILISNMLVIFSIVGFYAFAQLPPLPGNTPLDNGPTAQTKSGALTVTGGITLGNTLKLWSTTNPGAQPTGSVYFDSTAKTIKYYDGTVWQSAGGSASMPSGSLAGTCSAYYSTDGTGYVGCRLNWGVSTCSGGCGCQSGYTNRILMTADDHISSTEYMTLPCHNYYCHVNLYGCIKN